MIALRTDERRFPAVEALFADGARRKLIIVIDIDTIDLVSGVTVETMLLAGQLGDENIDSYRYSDGGAPSDASTLTTRFWGSAPIGWLEVTPDEEPDALRTHGISWCDGELIHDGAIGGETAAALGMNIAQVRGEDLKFESTPDSVLVAACAEMGADILVTSRAGLASLRSDFARNLTIVGVDPAVALVGLFLRSRGIYLQAATPNITVKTSKTNFYQSSALLFLPDHIELLHRVQIQADDKGLPQLKELAGAAFSRISRCIERRDQVWRLIDQPPTIDTGEDIAATMETLLTYLMGTLDAMARLLHIVYSLRGELHHVGWQKATWSSELRRNGLSIWETVYGHPSHPHALTVVRLLRNSIHAEGLASVAFRQRGKIAELRLMIPRKDGRPIMAAASLVSPLSGWGLQELASGEFIADPGLIVERTILATIEFVADVEAALLGYLRTVTHLPGMPFAERGIFSREAVADAQRMLLGWNRSD
ncbi:hypothetical protein ACUWEX_01690 [Okibacterium fritillariae]|uniref:hypothetical protein n=1 Tax=Okibacterium fritillariae TaxID=123320 RepID=UPI004055921A